MDLRVKHKSENSFHIYSSFPSLLKSYQSHKVTYNLISFPLYFLEVLQVKHGTFILQSYQFHKVTCIVMSSLLYFLQAYLAWTEESPTSRNGMFTLVTSNFYFSPSVFKRLILQTCKNQGLFGKGLSICSHP